MALPPLQAKIDDDGEAGDVGDREEAPQGPTPLAKRIARLQEASVHAARTRGRLPQPLFWSLFRSEIEEIRKMKGLRDIIETVLK